MSYDACVWYCGDDCDCSQPVIQRRTQTFESPGGRLLTTNIETLWAGEFRVHAWGDEGDPEADLAQALAYLEALA